MMIETQLTSTRKEAYLNEYKGLLFEFLVAHNLAKHYKFEATFLKTLSAQMMSTLQSYQKQIRHLDLELARELPNLAQQCCQFMVPLLGPSVKAVDLVGKLKTDAATHTESDLNILCSDHHYAIGLKLSKNQAYVNTKSGGLKSFISSYFPSDLGERAQQQLNQLVEASFFDMGRSMYEQVNLKWQGHFGPEWARAGFSELPGELPEHLHKILSSSYARLAQSLCGIFVKIQQEDCDVWTKGITKLCGMSQPDLWQIICFHQATANGRYQLAKLELLNHDLLSQEVPNATIGEHKANLASFTIQLKHLSLQIRVKPMNVFTQAAMKVNCSLKFASTP